MNGKRLASYQLTANSFATGGNTTLVEMMSAVAVQDTYFGRRRLAPMDRLSSATAVGSQSVSFYPYGQDKGTVGANDSWKFATYWRDSATGLDYAMNRYYSSAVGRFVTPDPYLNSAGPGEPQSWNRYPYTRDDPTNRLDTSGKYDCVVDGFERAEDCCDPGDPFCDEGGGQGGEGGGGGTGPPPLLCSFTKFSTGMPGVYKSATTGIKNYSISLYFQFTATGGNGSYVWSNTNTFVQTGLQSFNTGAVAPPKPSGIDPGGIYIFSQSGNTVIFGDQPGVPLVQPLGTVTAAAILQTFDLQATVTSGTQTVQCPTVWSETLFVFQVKKGKPVGFGAGWLPEIIP